MRVIVAAAAVLALFLQPSMTVSRAASKKEAVAARECQDAGHSGDVTLRFCSWNEGGNWNVSYEVKNGNKVTKSVTLNCVAGKIDQNITDTVAASEEKYFLSSKLPGSDIKVRPEPNCKLGRIRDPGPRSTTPEQ